MGLQARLTLAFLALVALLSGGTTLALYQSTEAQFQADFEAQVRAAQQGVRHRLDRDAAALRDRMTSLAQDSRVSALLQDLTHGRYDSEPERQKSVVEQAEAMRTGTGLDVLWILDQDMGNRVLAAPHRLGDTTLPKPLRTWLKRKPGHVVVKEAIARSGRPVVLSALEVGVARDRLMLIGGRVLGQGVAEDLRVSAIAEVTLRDGDGEVVATTLTDAPGEAEPAGYETARVLHRNVESEPPALEVLVHVSQASHRERLATLVRTAGAVTAAAILLALLLGWQLARRVVRPVRTLVEATRRVADGDRELGLVATRRDEVGELVDAFEAMTRELDEREQQLRRTERVAAWQDIARELAHEIKNPLTPIRMAIETIRRTWQRKHPRFEEVFEESTATILEEVDRLKDIVTEFSQFARMPNPSPRPCRLNDLVHQAVVLYGVGDEVTLIETLDPELGEQHLDPDRMTQVIQNLLKNAIAATTTVERPGEVQIGTRRVPEHDEVELVVADNGCGIADDDLPRVFTPYFTKKVGGTGLGLAVVHRIVSGHGGRVGVSSVEGEGTRFIIRLPIGGAPS